MFTFPLNREAKRKDAQWKGTGEMRKSSNREKAKRKGERAYKASKVCEVDRRRRSCGRHQHNLGRERFSFTNQSKRHGWAEPNAPSVDIPVLMNESRRERSRKTSHQQAQKSTCNYFQRTRSFRKVSSVNILARQVQSVNSQSRGLNQKDPRVLLRRGLITKSAIENGFGLGHVFNRAVYWSATSRF